MTSGIVLKAIKPQRLNVEAIRAAIGAEAESIGNDMLLDFELTTWTWKLPVKFEKLVNLGTDKIEILVGTDNEIYGYVDEGTRPHIIRPKRARALHFQGVYTAKTVPGVLAARPGGASGNDVYAKQVRHPGTKARKFTQRITKIWDKRLAKRVEKALQQAVKVSGHAM